MTGYEAELLSAFASPSTGCTSTFTVVSVANATWPRSLNVTVFDSPGLIESIVFVATIGDGCCSIVSVTLICTSWWSPVSSIVTANARSVPAVTMLSVSVERTISLGKAFVSTMPVPCRPPVVVPPSVAAPFTRSNTGSQ